MLKLLDDFLLLIKLLKMDKLTQDQKDEYATSFAAIALYDGGVSCRAEVDVMGACSCPLRWHFGNRMLLADIASSIVAV